MPEDTFRREAITRRTGGAYSLTKTFALLDISPSFGHALVKAGKIQVVRLGPASPRVTDDEVARLLREGIPNEKPATRRGPSRRTPSAA